MICHKLVILILVEITKTIMVCLLFTIIYLLYDIHLDYITLYV